MNRFGFYNTYERDLPQNYVVQKGDSLYKIAKKFGIPLDDLIDANNIVSSVIYPNQVLVIPSGEVGNLYFEEYVVKYDDTIETISQKLNVPTLTIVRYNDVTKLVLAENQVILIPRQYKEYVIQDGDTIEQILSTTGLTLNELFEINKTNWLKPGNIIYVK